MAIAAESFTLCRSQLAKDPVAIAIATASKTSIIATAVVASTIVANTNGHLHDGQIL
jgi:hypothetical protein